MKKFFLHPWEGDEEHLSLRQIAKREGVDQQTVLRLVAKGKFLKPDGGGSKPYWVYFTYRRFEAERSQPQRTSAVSPRGYVTQLKMWQEYWDVDTDDDPFAGGVPPKCTTRYVGLQVRDEI